jgi:hypothetical protein
MTNHFQLRLHKRCTEMYLLAICIQVFSVFYLTDAVTHLELYPGLQCSYNYDLEVHTHRGERSTEELNFKINARVSFGDICSCDFYAILYVLFQHEQPRCMRAFVVQQFVVQPKTTTI